MDPLTPQNPGWRWATIRPRWALLAGGLFLLNALWLAFTVALDLKASGRAMPFREPLVWELSSGFIVWLLVPLAQTVALNAPWRQVPWRRFIGLHLAGAALFWSLHVAGLWSLRTAIYRLAGWGAYDYGDIVFRVPMEGLKDVGAFAALAGIFHVVDIRRRRQARELAAARLETELREARLQVLSGQLDPHFLFNALNTLSAVMYEDLARADRLLGDLGQMLRNGLDAGSAVWTLDQELAHLAHYLAFVEARFGDRIRVSQDIEPGLGALPLPRFALQRLVENALKHNEDTAGRILHISVAARWDGASACLFVTDDGAGFQGGEATGLGLDNLRRSLALLHGDRARLDAANRPEGGAEVSIMLPLEASRG